LYFFFIIIIIQDSVGRSVGRLALIDAIFVDSVRNWWSSMRLAAVAALCLCSLQQQQQQHVRGRCGSSGGGSIGVAA